VTSEVWIGLKQIIIELLSMEGASISMPVSVMSRHFEHFLLLSVEKHTVG